MDQTEQPDSDHILCFAFSAVSWGRWDGRWDGWIWKCGGLCHGEVKCFKLSPTVRACCEVDISIHPACSVALYVCYLAVIWAEFGCTALEIHLKGTINELCRVRGILKAMLFEERKIKVSFRHCLRRTLSGLESINRTTSTELECHKVARSFPSLCQTFRCTGELLW